MMIKVILAMLVSTLGYAQSDTVVSLEGKVVSGGNGLNRTISIVSPDELQDNLGTVCYNKQGKKIDKLSGMELQVSGSWKTIGRKKKRRCLKVEKISILKVASGRKPLVGFLVKKDGKFFLNEESGKLIELFQPSSAMQNFLGTKVIVDAVPSADKKSESFRVVSYLAFP